MVLMSCSYSCEYGFDELSCKRCASVVKSSLENGKAAHNGGEPDEDACEGDAVGEVFAVRRAG